MIILIAANKKVYIALFVLRFSSTVNVLRAITLKHVICCFGTRVKCPKTDDTFYFTSGFGNSNSSEIKSVENIHIMLLTLIFTERSIRLKPRRFVE